MIIVNKSWETPAIDDEGLDELPTPEKFILTNLKIFCPDNKQRKYSYYLVYIPD